jgi:dTDP-glucose 4,6-dehydratase
MNILVTGSAGFIGSAFVRMLLGHPLRKNAGHPRLTEGTLVSLDLLTYAGCLDNLAPVQGESRHKFYKGDIRDRRLVAGLVHEHRINAIVNFAAESHVDRSIEGSEIFAQTNVLGTLNLLEVAREHRLRYVQVSTDEVYGSLGEVGSFTEETPMAPNSPYSASKAAADCFVRSYVHTHGLEAVITRCSNNYGPYQFPEKFIPLAITNLIDGKKIPVYGTGRNARDWIHVEDHAEGVWLALTRGRKGEVYNFGGYGEMRNLEVANKLLAAFRKSPDEGLEYVTDRKGHDWRYAMDPAKAANELNWKPRWDFDEGLNSMIEWYRQNEAWWRPKSLAEKPGSK